MEKYSSYKDSGVKWLGEIPSHWEVVPTKSCLDSSTSGIWGNDPINDGSDIICLRVADFNYEKGVVRIDKLTYRNYSKDLSNDKVLKDGDLLLEKSGGGDLFPVGRVVRFDSCLPTATCSNFIQILRPNKNVCSSFIYYSFYVKYTRKVNGLFFNQTTGIQNLKVKEYLNSPIALPPLSEQDAIASYLDSVTTQIDVAIEQQKKMIELLNERKQIIINNAVTKGLDPNVKMKDSGVDWIGEIPEGWEVCSLKKVATIILGKMLSNNPTEKYPYLCAKDVHYGNVDLSDLKMMYFSKEERERYRVQNGDMLIVEGGAGAGGCAVFDGDMEVFIQNSIMIVRGNSNMDNRFICYFFQTINQKGYVEFICNKATIPHFTKEKVGAVMLPIPPIEEQMQIVNKIKSICEPIDNAINAANDQISLLQERKQIIINEVVTGKVKVV